MSKKNLSQDEENRLYADTVLHSKRGIFVRQELALLLGLNEAIFIQQLSFWIEEAEKGKYVAEDGRTYLRSSLENWQKNDFPFWHVSTVKRTIAKLEKDGFILSRNDLNPGYDVTKSYAINYEKIGELVKIKKNNIGSNCNNGEQKDSIGSNCNNYLDQNAPVKQTNLSESTLREKNKNREKEEPLREKSNKVVTSQNGKDSLSPDFEKFQNSFWEIYPEYEGVLEKGKVNQVLKKIHLEDQPKLLAAALKFSKSKKARDGCIYKPINFVTKEWRAEAWNLKGGGAPGREFVVVVTSEGSKEIEIDANGEIVNRVKVLQEENLGFHVIGPAIEQLEKKNFKKYARQLEEIEKQFNQVE